MAGTPVVAALNMLTAPVHINVGGTNYTSCLQTLTKFPYSRLAKMFNGTEPIGVDPTKQCYFLDRDGKSFRHILNFLRNAELILPDSYTESALLLKEATFFEIDDLCTALTEKPSEEPERLKSSSDLDNDVSEDNSSVGDGEDNQTQEKTKKRNKRRRKKQVHAKGVNEKDSNDDELSDDESDDVEEKIITQGNPANKNDLPVQISLPENKLSPSSDIICVFSDYLSGAVIQLWFSDNEFTIEFPNDNSHHPSDRPLIYKGQQFCRRCLEKLPIHDCDCYAFCNICRRSMSQQSSKKRLMTSSVSERINVQLSWMAKYLFRNGYKLLSPCSFVKDRGVSLSPCSFVKDHGVSGSESVLYHCFVK